jgi:hypothetical protein
MNIPDLHKEPLRITPSNSETRFSMQGNEYQEACSSDESFRDSFHATTQK